MIRHLSISNYVLIDHLEIDLDKGLSIFTGETGSGKSILLGALALAMGERADSKALLDKSRKCIVELEVDISGLGLEALFDEFDLDYSNSSTLRRQIDPQGRSRAFVNDSPVKLNALKAVSSRIVHVHSQHKNALIGSAEFQFNVLDHVAGATQQRAEYTALYNEWHALKSHLEVLEAQEKNASIDEDYFKFQLQELEQAALKNGEQEELEELNSTLEHADELRELATIVDQSDGQNILAPLEELKDRLAKAKRLNAALADLSERMDVVLVESKDLFSDLEKEVASVEVDPAEREKINKRLDLIYGIQQKHRVNSIQELQALQEELAQKISGISSLEDEIGNVSRKLEQLSSELIEVAKVLSEERKNIAPEVGARMEAHLHELGMPSAVFKVKLGKLESPGLFGCDKLEFAFSANKGVPEQTLGKIASGGELSRTMLAMISLVTDAQGLPAVIFDEIDTGVSGDIAARVGKMMKHMAEDMQVICITHLPQIAGKADAHFKVLREENAEMAKTLVRPLNGEERVTEIAQMLSGTTTTEAAMNNARALLIEE